MSGPKQRLINVGIALAALGVFVYIVRVNIAFLFIIFLLSAQFWSKAPRPHFHHTVATNPISGSTNVISGETFQVDLDLDAEGRSYHITRAYKCSGEIVSDHGSYGIAENVFANQRIITQHLPSGNTVFIAVPNGCSAIWDMRVHNLPCSAFNNSAIRTHPVDMDCSRRWPVIRNHIPLVFWTGDIGKTKTLVAYVSSASFEAHGSHVQKAVATMTLQKGLAISPPDENNWLSAPLDQTSTEYIGYIKTTDASCRTDRFESTFSSYRFGAPIPKQSSPCIVPIDADGNAMEQFSGLMWLYTSPNKIEEFIEFARRNRMSEVRMGIREPKQFSYDR